MGELAARAGVAPSALRFWESQGLIAGARTSGGQRRFPRSTLRRVAFIRAAQRVGLDLEAIRAALAALPGGRTPTQADWRRLSRRWRPLLDERIRELCELRDALTRCIGCGCLSLKTCRLANPDDVAGREGSGARYLRAGHASAPRGPRALGAGRAREPSV